MFEHQDVIRGEWVSWSVIWWIRVLHNGERKSQWKGFTNKSTKKKIDYKKATKKKIKISLDRNLISRPNKNKLQPKQ